MVLSSVAFPWWIEAAFLEIPFRLVRLLLVVYRCFFEATGAFLSGSRDYGAMVPSVRHLVAASNFLFSPAFELTAV